MVWSLANTLGEGNESVAGVLQSSDGLGKDDLGSVLVDFVVESEDGAGVGGNLSVVVCHDGGGIVLPVVGVEVPKGDGLASDSGNFLHHVIVVSEGRTDECRVCPSDLHDCLFDEPELVMELVPVESVEVFVGPSVGGDLMTLVIGELDPGSLIFIVDAASLATPVVAVEEEGALAPCGGQSVGDLVEVPPRTVIEGKGCSARDSAGSDNFTRGSLEKLLEGVSVVVARDGSAIDGSSGEGASVEDRAEHIRR